MLHPLPTSFPRPLLSRPASSPRVLLSRAVSPARVPLSRPASSPVPIMARSELFGRWTSSRQGFSLSTSVPLQKWDTCAVLRKAGLHEAGRNHLSNAKENISHFPQVKLVSVVFLESASPLANSSILRRFRCRRLREPL